MRRKSARAAPDGPQGIARHLVLGLAVLSMSFGAGCAGEEADADAVWLTALDRASHRSRFPIDRGAHRNANCNACHGAFDTFTQFDCLGCHPRGEAEDDHDDVRDFAYDSARCYACHPDGEED